MKFRKFDTFCIEFALPWADNVLGSHSK